jgi:hypothetical protein
VLGYEAKEDGMGGIGNSAGKMGNAYRNLVENPQVKDPLEGHGRYNNKYDLKSYICESMGRIKVVTNKMQ